MTLIGEVRWKRSNIYGLVSRVHIDMNCRDIKELNKDRLIEEDCTELKAVPVINISGSTERLPSFWNRFIYWPKWAKRRICDLARSVLFSRALICSYGVLENTRKWYTTSAININHDGMNKSHFATCIDHAWDLFWKYYELTDKSRAYAVAMTLDPH